MPFKLKKVISGGQTGADRAGLECARDLGLETGGWAPRGFRTENGPDPSLKDFGLVETASDDYPTRTRYNVRDSDATIWFGSKSPGYWCTKKAADKLGKPFIENPTNTQHIVIVDRCETINIAGNRLSTNPNAAKAVEWFFGLVQECII